MDFMHSLYTFLEFISELSLLSLFLANHLKQGNGCSNNYSEWPNVD
jgi:hypothetical protein